MYFEAKSKYLHYTLHLTRWVAPSPQYTPSIMLPSPIRISKNKIKKVKIPYVPFTSIHFTDIQSDT